MVNAATWPVDRHDMSDKPSTLKFGSTVIYVADDVPGTLDFYRRAFGLETRFYDPAYEFGELETGGPPVAFATYRTGEMLMPGEFRRPDADQPLAVEIAFFTADVAAAFAQAVGAGAKPVAEPKVMPWGQAVAYVRSIEGTLVGLCSPPGTKSDETVS
jgi:predicted enzyme related to lactoylglutathione lyase